jgi:hypothetical protein
MENKQLVFPSRQRSSAPVGLVKDFLAKNNVSISHTLLPLTTVDFYLFLRLKSTLKRRRFCDANDIIKNATEELKRLPQNGYVSKTFTVVGRSV